MNSQNNTHNHPDSMFEIITNVETLKTRNENNKHMKGTGLRIFREVGLFYNIKSIDNAINYCVRYLNVNKHLTTTSTKITI